MYENGIRLQSGQINDRKAEVFAPAFYDDMSILFKQFLDGWPSVEPVGGTASVENFTEFIFVFPEQFSSEESSGNFN